MMPVVDNLDPDQEHKGSTTPPKQNPYQQQGQQSQSNPNVKQGFTQFKK
jgi:hypothetical protein